MNAASGSRALNGTLDAVGAAAHARRMAGLMGLDDAGQSTLFSAILAAAERIRSECGDARVAWTMQHVGATTARLRLRIDGAPRGDDAFSSNRSRPRDQGRTAHAHAHAFRIVTDTSAEAVFDLERDFADGERRLEAARRIDALACEDTSLSAADLLQEILPLNAALRAALGEADRARDELSRLARELEETNRGVVALYAELDERADELLRADRAKTRFLSNVSHELRTPLNSIRALAGLLLDRLDGPLNDEQMKQVRFIHTEANDLRETVDDLLDIAKIASGKSDVQRAPFEIAELFGALRGTLKPLLADNAVRLHFDDASGLPTMVSDEPKISQILRNLVSNALKFTQTGEVRVAASESGDGSLIRFEVSDTGIGIAAENLDRIFEEFVQIANPLQVKTKGTGLGLPLCRRLATLLGGSIDVESEPDKGSIFTVILPRVNEACAPVRNEAALVQSSSTQARAPAPPGERLRILLIDDDATARYALRRRLEDGRVFIEEAGDGESGIAAAARIAPHLVILDLQLPDMHGRDVLRHLRAEHDVDALPVAILTSLEIDPILRAELEAECRLVLSKSEIGAPDFDRRLIGAAADAMRAIRT